MHKNPLFVPRRIVWALLVLALLAQTACESQEPPTAPSKTALNKPVSKDQTPTLTLTLTGNNSGNSGGGLSSGRHSIVFQEVPLDETLLQHLDIGEDSQDTEKQLLQDLKGGLQRAIGRKDKVDLSFAKGTNPFFVLMAYTMRYCYTFHPKINYDQLLKIFREKGAFNTSQKIKFKKGESEYDLSMVGLAIAELSYYNIMEHIGLIEELFKIEVEHKERQKTKEGKKEYDLSTLGLAMIKDNAGTISLMKKLVALGAKLEASQYIKEGKKEYDLSTVGLAMVEGKYKDFNNTLKTLSELKASFNKRQHIKEGDRKYDLSTVGLAIKESSYDCIELTNEIVHLGAELEASQRIEEGKKEYDLSTVGLAIKESSYNCIELIDEIFSPDLKANLKERQRIKEGEKEYDLSTVGLVIKDRHDAYQDLIELIKKLVDRGSELEVRERIKEGAREKEGARKYDLSTVGLVIETKSSLPHICMGLIEGLVELGVKLDSSQNIKEKRGEYNLSTVGYLLIPKLCPMPTHEKSVLISEFEKEINLNARQKMKDCWDVSLLGLALIPEIESHIAKKIIKLAESSEVDFGAKQEMTVQRKTKKIDLKASIEAKELKFKE